MVVSLSRCRFSWRALPACLAILIGAGLLVLPAQAQTIAPKDAVGRLFVGPSLESGWFAPSFLSVVSVDQVNALVSGLKGDFGGLVAVHDHAQGGRVELERAEVPFTVTLDGAGRIAGLFFGPPQPTRGAPAALAERIATSAAGESAVLLLVDGKELASRKADAPMAVGSAFKLVVLKAYEEAIRDGTLTRDRVIPLDAADRSLPTGVLQRLASGTPVTVETLAALMIQQSDNTATDALIRLLGPAAMERLSPRNTPFLTTGALFRLAAKGAEAKRTAYGAGRPEERRVILDELAGTPLPSPSDLLPRATWRDAEWYLTARELCGLLLELRDAPALNGVPEPLVAVEGWRWTGYKGGSEFGVLNLSAAGITADGRQVCAVLTANGDRPQPEDRLARLFSTLFRSAEKSR
ncbi:serine hydrolase (plasmid) [Azospirillum argentinense]|uniref:Serine hydrolase n=1 Tax=Azospirillum argentinense TaxID=2970906 RepID=A0A4D8PN31_9PROT|nr:serine hydrolase [Azospirillum argentinense]QCN98644.1 serine hydrolase [Azospirillum argentinense]